MMTYNKTVVNHNSSKLQLVLKHYIVSMTQHGLDEEPNRYYKTSHWVCCDSAAQNNIFNGLLTLVIWIRSRNRGCLVTWFCYQLIAKWGNKTATVPWPDPFVKTPVSKLIWNKIGICFRDFWNQLYWKLFWYSMFIFLFWCVHTLRTKYIRWQ